MASEVISNDDHAWETVRLGITGMICWDMIFGGLYRHLVLGTYDSSIFGDYMSYM